MEHKKTEGFGELVEYNDHECRFGRFELEWYMTLRDNLSTVDFELYHEGKGPIDFGTVKVRRDVIDESNSDIAELMLYKKMLNRVAKKIGMFANKKMLNWSNQCEYKRELAEKNRTIRNKRWFIQKFKQLMILMNDEYCLPNKGNEEKFSAFVGKKKKNEINKILSELVKAALVHKQRTGCEIIIRPDLKRIFERRHHTVMWRYQYE